MIPGDLLSAFPHRQFHTLPSLLDSWAALPNSNPNACMPMQGGSLYHFYDGLWYDLAGTRTLDLPCERRTRYRLSQPDKVIFFNCCYHHFGFHFCLSTFYQERQLYDCKKFLILCYDPNTSRRLCFNTGYRCHMQFYIIM